MADPWTFQLLSIPMSAHTAYERIVHALQLNDDMHLVHTLEGRGTLWVDGVPYETSPAAVVAVPIFKRCYWEKPAGTVWTMINLHVRLYERDGIPLHEQVTLPVVFTPDGLPAIHAKLRRWQARWQQADAFDRAAVSGEVLTLVAGYLQNHGTMAVDMAGLDREMFLVRRQLEDQAAGEFDSAALADQANLSTSQLNRRFRACWGVSPKAYWQRHRLALAQSMLRRSQRSIGQVAGALGFADIFYFSRWFKEQAGITPTQYRKQLPNL